MKGFEEKGFMKTILITIILLFLFIPFARSDVLKYSECCNMCDQQIESDEFMLTQIYFLCEARHLDDCENIKQSIDNLDVQPCYDMCYEEYMAPPKKDDDKQFFGLCFIEEINTN